MKSFRFSLTFSILSSLACLIGLTWILLSLVSFKTAEQDLLSQKNEQVRILLATLVSILPDSFPQIDGTDQVAKFLGKLSRERDFAGIVVIDRDGAAVYAIGDDKGADERLRETLKSGEESSLLAPNGLSLMRYAPLLVDGRISGAARLSLSLSGEYERLKRSRQIFFAYFVLDFLLLLALGSYLLSRIVVVPIRRLLAATERLAAGDYSQAVHVPGSAEIAELAEAFSQMQETLRGKREEVESYVKSLERSNLELQAAREESLRSEKMASVGLLAAGMAHEIGTPLSSIIGYAEIMRDELHDDPVKADYLRRIESESARIDRLIRGLLDFARPRVAHFEAVELANLLRDTLDLCADRETFRKIEFTLQVENGLPSVLVDPNQLQQVLMNLFLNARDAMPAGGVLEIAAHRSEFSAAQQPLEVGAESVVMGRRREDFSRVFANPRTMRGSIIPCIKLEIRDHGGGIPAENLTHIFDPFFTTKEPGKGTGLGLAISARIIDTFGGRITLASTPGTGTVFTIWLPLPEAGVSDGRVGGGR